MPSSHRILILGANGRLGRALARRYPARYECTAWGREELDLTQVDSIPRKLEAQPFDVLINAAGLTSVDLCESRQEDARLSNAVAPGVMAGFCAKEGRRFIHLSSDYVFSGQASAPLTEDSPTGPVNLYGQTKLDGELAVLDANPQALVARVSWLFGPDKPSFPDMIIQRAQTQETISAVSDKWSSPTYSEDLSDWLELLFTDHAGASGLIHLCNQGAPSWQEYGQKALEIADQLGLPLKTRCLEGHSMQGFDAFSAERPPYTVLATDRFAALTGHPPRRWEEALEAYLQQVLA